MWVSELDVKGFKHLRGGWTLAPGLTLVTGPNESGKSTFQELLVRTLCGFSRSERRRSGGSSQMQHRRPWSGGPFGVNAVLEDVRGRRLRVEWDFDDYEVVVRDANTGEDLSAQVRGSRDGVKLGEFLFELRLDEYQEVCCLHQAAVAPVRHSEELALVLRRSIESGAEEVGVEDADEVLKDYLRERLGVHTRFYGPLRNGPLDRLEAELEDTLARIDAIRHERSELEQDAAEIEQLREGRDAAARRLEEVRQRLFLTQLRAVEARLGRAVELEEQARDHPDDPVELPEELERSVRRKLERIADLHGDEEDLQAAAAASEGEIAELERKRREIRPELDRLAVYEGTDTSEEQPVRNALARLERPEDSGERPSAPSPDPEVERYRAERARLQGLAAAPGTTVWDLMRVGVAGVLALASVLAGALVHPGAFAGLIAAALVLWSARGRATNEELQAGLASLGAASLPELEERLAADERRIAEAHGALREWERRREEAAGARKVAEGDLVEALDQAGASPSTLTRERAAAYLTACEKQTRLAGLKAEMAQVESGLGRLREPARELAERRRERAELERALAAELTRLGIDSADLSGAPEAFEAVARRAAADAGRVRRAEEAARRRTELLAGESVERLEERRRELEQRLREHRALHGELAIEPGDEVELSREADELQRRFSELDRMATGRESAVQERERALDDPADLKARRDELSRRVKEAELARDAIRIAREELEAAAREAHQEFAPHLVKALRANLDHITGGRYREATVDEKLNICVQAPETGKLVSVEQLSRGTQDQIYLVERLELTRLLDPTTGEAPLLLDDPFARFDDVRLRYGLEVLRGVAAERQVVLFSEARDLGEMAQEVCGECRVIELTPWDGPVSMAG